MQRTRTAATREMMPKRMVTSWRSFSTGAMMWACDSAQVRASMSSMSCVSFRLRLKRGLPA
jgi:hypothetical protein